MVGRVLRNYGEERAAVSVPNDDNPAIFLLYGRVFSLLFIIIFFLYHYSYILSCLSHCILVLLVFKINSSLLLLLSLSPSIHCVAVSKHIFNVELLSDIVFTYY